LPVAPAPAQSPPVAILSSPYRSLAVAIAAQQPPMPDSNAGCPTDQPPSAAEALLVRECSAQRGGIALQRQIVAGAADRGARGGRVVRSEERRVGKEL